MGRSYSFAFFLVDSDWSDQSENLSWWAQTSRTSRTSPRTSFLEKTSDQSD